MTILKRLRQIGGAFLHLSAINPAAPVNIAEKRKAADVSIPAWGEYSDPVLQAKLISQPRQGG